MTAPSSKTTTFNAADALIVPGRAAGDPDRPALLAGDAEYSYAELEGQVARAGRALKGLGLARQQRLVLLVDDRPEFFFAYLGAFKIGAVPVALNLRLSAKELAFILKDTGTAIVITDPEFLPRVEEAVAIADAAVTVVLTGHRPDTGLADLPDLMRAEADTLASEPMAPDEMSLWMYTSGTTGNPKAVVHTVASIYACERYFGEIFGAGPGIVVFSSSKLFFAYALGHVLLAGLRLGATLVLHAGWPTGEDISQVIHHRRPDIVLTVPTLYRNLLRDGFADTEHFKAVRHYISAGEHLPESLFRQWHERTGRPIIDCIGATENLVLFVGNRPDNLRPGSSGIAMPHTQVRLKSEDGRPVTEPGTPGILWVKSETLAAGYWGQDALSESAFQDGWYRTNDVFTTDGDGWFYYQGRADDMLKISGQWVSPAEIEAHVNKNPKVGQSVVVGVENEEGLVRLALCMVPSDPQVDRTALEAELTADLTANLAIYKCPRRFVYVDELPQTATGKVQRFRVRDLVAAAMTNA